MSVIKSLAWYAVPRPITDVVVNGLRVYQCFRRDRRQAQNHAEEIYKAIFRVIAAVPFTFIVWHLCNNEWLRTKIRMGYLLITFLSFVGIGHEIARPSLCLAICTLAMMNSLRNCAQSYANPRLRAWFVFNCAGALAAFYVMQKYDQAGEGLLDKKIHSWAKTLSRKSFPY